METTKNILRAIAGESMARNKYTYFASKAKKEGFEQISAIFTETADNEKEHAKRLMKLLKGGEKSTLENYDFPTVGPKTCPQPLPVKNMNGLQCIRNLLKPPKKRVLMKQPAYLLKSARSKSTTKNAT